MVKPVRQKNNVLLTFRVTPPITPVTTKRISHPRVSLVPREVRRLAWNESLEGFEPVSPRVSFTGHIDCQMKGKPGARKHKQAASPLAQALAEQIKRKVLSVRKRGYESDVLVEASEIEETAAPSLWETRQVCKGRSMFSYFDRRTYEEEEKGKVLNGRKRGGYEFDVEAATEAAQSAPSLQQMRRICTGRSTLSDRDWSTYGAEEKGKVSKGRKRSYEFDVSDAQAAAESDMVAPSLQKMKQFGKGRSTLSDFDWSASDTEEKSNFFNGTNPGSESYVSDSPAANTVAPSLHQMKQFCTGRSRLSDFDRRTDDAKDKGLKRKRL